MVGGKTGDHLEQLCLDGVALTTLHCASLDLGGLFAVNMTLKEGSLSRYPAWEEYKRRIWLLLPLVI